MTECNKCGECCKSLQFTIPGLENDRLRREYFKARGIKIIEGNKVLIPHRCPLLTADNKCEVWGTPRQPIHCKRYRGQSGYHMPEGCAFNPKNKEEKNVKNN